MKKVKKQIQLNFESMSTDLSYDDGFPKMLKDCGFVYKFFSKELILKPENLEFFIEIEEPQTLKEFIENENLTKGDLLDWLKENYK